MNQTRYEKNELIRIRPWPHICPDCKGDPVRIVRSGTRTPFACQVLGTVRDVVGPEGRWIVRCDLCMGTGTVFK